eukprot:788644-Prymnesium_polylepis.2
MAQATQQVLQQHDVFFVDTCIAKFRNDTDSSSCVSLLSIVAVCGCMLRDSTRAPGGSALQGKDGALDEGFGRS